MSYFNAYIIEKNGWGYGGYDLDWGGIFGPTSVPVNVKYDNLKLLMTNGWLDQNIITWFLA